MEDTIRNSINEYIIYMKNDKKSSNNTLDSYNRDLNHMADFMLDQGIIDIKKITATNVNSYVLYLERNGKSSSTIVRNISSMKTFFHYLLRRGIIKEEPTERIRPPKVEKKHIENVSEDSIIKIINSITGDSPIELRDKAMISLMYYGNMRVSHIVDIKVENYDHIFECIRYDDGKSERVINISRELKKDIDAYLEKGRPSLSKKEDITNLFLNCRGGSLSRQGLWKIIKEKAKEAKIDESITPFGMGHSR